MGIQYNRSQNPFGQKFERPNFFGKLMNYGLGVGKIMGGVAEGIAGNPAGFVDAGEQFMGVLRDKLDNKFEKFLRYSITMPFGQKFGSYLRTGFGNVKNFLGNAYNTTKKTLGSLDSMFGDMKKIYGAVQPALKDLAPQQMQGGLAKLDSAVMKGVQGYEGIRNKIDDAEQTMISKVGDVMSKVGGVQKTLKDQGVKFNFA